MREHGVEVPIFQAEINKFHDKLESKNKYAERIRSKIIELDSYMPVKEMLDNDESVYVIDRGNYMHHSLCLHKEEEFNINKLFGATNTVTGKRSVEAFMTIKEANSINPFAICREIKLKKLIELVQDDSNYGEILINYSSPEEKCLCIPANIIEEIENEQ